LKCAIVLVDTPNGEARASAPIRDVIAMHHHWDHMGGIRSAIDESATIDADAPYRTLHQRLSRQKRSLWVRHIHLAERFVIQHATRRHDEHHDARDIATIHSLGEEARDCTSGLPIEGCRRRRGRLGDNRIFGDHRQGCRQCKNREHRGCSSLHFDSLRRIRAASLPPISGQAQHDEFRRQTLVGFDPP